MALDRPRATGISCLLLAISEVVNLVLHAWCRCVCHRGKRYCHPAPCRLFIGVNQALSSGWGGGRGRRREGRGGGNGGGRGLDDL